MAEFLGGFSTIFFLQGRVVSRTPNPHPGGPGHCIYIPQRQSGLVITPHTGYPFQWPLTTRMGYGGTILISRSPHGKLELIYFTIICLLVSLTCHNSSGSVCKFCNFNYQCKLLFICIELFVT
jgi:hypothetical protein